MSGPKGCSRSCGGGGTSSDMPRLALASTPERPERALQWFGAFSAGGGGHQHGALALSRFAFKHRDEHWHLLAWAGPHPHSPVLAASKPQLFYELDVATTVRALLVHAPDFWSSPELRDSLVGGTLVALDNEFFAGEFAARLAAGNAEAWELTSTYLREEADYGLLCRRLLPLADEADLLVLLNAVAAPADNGRSEEATPGGALLESAVLCDITWSSYGEAVFCNAVALHRRQLQRLLNEDTVGDDGVGGMAVEANDRAALVVRSDDTVAHWNLAQRLAGYAPGKARRLLELEAWGVWSQLAAAAVAASHDGGTALAGCLTAAGVAFSRVGVAGVAADDASSSREPAGKAEVPDQVTDAALLAWLRWDAARRSDSA
eukprot:SM000067S20306  [mRNA]  locus=s67:232691:234251:+ [translate_table: standard]